MLQPSITRALLLDAPTRGIYEFLFYRAQQIGSCDLALTQSQISNMNGITRSQVSTILKRLARLDAIGVDAGKGGTRITLPSNDPPTEKQIRALKSLRRLDPAMKDPATKEEARLLIRRLLALQKDEQEAKKEEAKKEEAPAPAPTQEDEELEEEGRIMTEEELEELDRKVAEIFKK